MATSLVKFNKNYVFSFIENFAGGFMLSSYESNRKNIKDGPVTFSLKYGKRRKLVKGIVHTELDFFYDYDGMREVFYFTPNNRAKFLSLIRNDNDE